MSRREADDSIQRGAQFVGHRSHEGTLHTHTLLGQNGLLGQLTFRLGDTGDVGGYALVADDLSLIVHHGVEGDGKHRASLALKGLDEMDSASM